MTTEIRWLPREGFEGAGTLITSCAVENDVRDSINSSSKKNVISLRGNDALAAMVMVVNSST